MIYGFSWQEWLCLILGAIVLIFGAVVVFANLIASDDWQ